MWVLDWFSLDAAVQWLVVGGWHLSAWQMALFTLALTHLTMISVTVFLHRHQAHRALELHPLASHGFRFWLWLTTGQVTREWTAIHRKHHAKVEQSEDPHSPHVHGIKTVLLRGYELYRAEAAKPETLVRYGHGTPDDWLERNLYSRFSWLGLGLMLVIDLALFGAAGLVVWAVQMAWTPVMAAGIINGAAHYWGYRNFEVPDASTNIFPWGILIAGEELHNNHHTYPTSARLSVRRFELDIGWQYIRLLQALGLASVRKTPPKLVLGEIRPLADEQTLEALISNRYEIMAGYAQEIRRAFKGEINTLRPFCADAVIQAARRWMHRDAACVPQAALAPLAQARAASPVLDKMLTMREELRQLWLNRSHTRAQLTHELQTWCQRAEASGIAALQEFSMRLRAARA